MPLSKQQRVALTAFLLCETLSEDDEYHIRPRKRLRAKEKTNGRGTESHTTLSIKELHFIERLDMTGCQNHLRMDTDVYDELLEMVTAHIMIANIKMDDGRSPHDRLVTTLSFLATGSSYRNVKSPEYIGSSAIVDTCKILIKVLKEHIHLPKTEDEWKFVAEDFETRWKYPHCIGAINGKHINIAKPKTGDDSYCRNYLKTHSVVLMAVTNAKGEFLIAEVRPNGMPSDGGVVYNNSKLCSLYEQGELNIPQACQVSGFIDNLQYVFVADDTFPLEVNVMTPYICSNISQVQNYYNYRLSRANRAAENAFDIMSSRFRILLNTIPLSPEKSSILILAICYLHNFLQKKCPNAYLKYINPNSDNVNQYNLLHLEPATDTNPDREAIETREIFCNYFKKSLNAT